MKKLHVLSFALSFGITFGIGIIFLGWIAMYGYGTKIVDILGSVYLGFDASWLGGLIGGGWAFLDAGIGAAVVAVIYNTIIRFMK